ncbi:MAG: TlpA disulfide reductase family protein [Terriglobia bacterium]|nr:TlpA disulfide reductase family protein [Terriglobia bacterium]
MDVRFSGWFSFFTLVPLALVLGCNRGAHPAQTGKVAPDFTVSDGTTTVRLSNYRGQVVLLNFWATWCPPCIEEMPSLLQLHHIDPNLVVLGVSIDEDPDAYASFVRTRHVDFITVRDPRQTAASLFHTDMWPETYVIDRKGIIRRKFVGAQDWTDPEILAYLKSL